MPEASQLFETEYLFPRIWSTIYSMIMIDYFIGKTSIWQNITDALSVSGND